MKKTQKYLAVLKLLFLICLFSCNAQQKKPEDKNADADTAKVSKKDSLFEIIKSQLPDTSFHTTDPKELATYILGKQKIFNDFLNTTVKNKQINPETFLTKAKIYFDDYQQYLWFKQIKQSPKDKKSMVRLSFSSPYSKLVTIKERLDYYSTFPQAIQQSAEGIKTKKILEEFSFVNIGQNFFGNETLWGVDATGRKTNINQLFNKDPKITIIVFGATYCGPCIYQERLLRDSYMYIDTANFRILGLSTDSSPSKWFTYVNKELLPWQTFVIDNGVNNPLVRRLGFEGVPRNFMLDKAGLIMDEHSDYRFFVNKFGYKE